MKKFFLPIALMLSWVLTSCSPEDDVIVEIDQDFSSWTIDGIPTWLSSGFVSIIPSESGKYLLSSNIYDYMDHHTAKKHELDSKQYISLSVGYGTSKPSKLITPNRIPDTETLVFSDESTDIRVLGYYDCSVACFTPGGKKITDEHLIQRIISSPAQVIYHLQNGGWSHQTDIIYGLDDAKEWIKPQFESALRTMCEDRFDQYSDKFFLGVIEFYISELETEEGKTQYMMLTDEDTNGRGAPFVLATYLMNDDHTMTRHIESFVAAEDGTISPLPFEDVKEIMMSKFGYADCNPIEMLVGVHDPDCLIHRYDENAN